MIVVQNKLSGFLLGRGYSAMCLLPFLFVRKGIDVHKHRELMNHERIHARQQIEMLWIFFFLWYAIEYMVRLIKFDSHHKAYHTLAHEQEAYLYQRNPKYLKTRKPFSWFKYL